MYTDPALTPYIEDAQQVNSQLGNLLRPAPDTPEAIAAQRRRIDQLADQQLARGPAASTPSAEERVLPGGTPVRVIQPGRVTAVYLHLHAGGWIIGSAQAADLPNARIATTCGVAVVSVDYRLAPEHPYPAALDDCANAAQRLSSAASAEFGTTRLLIGGESSGATLAVMTLLRLRGAVAFTAANRAFGCYDIGLTTPSQQRVIGTPVIDRRYLEITRPLIFPGLSAEQRRDPAISPRYADLPGLPTALFTVGTLDLFLDDSLFMAARWQIAGNTAQVDVYPESPHGFVSFPTRLAAIARQRIETFIAHHEAR
jgi:acetyl esterase